MKLGADSTANGRSRAHVLWDLFAAEVEEAGSIRLMQLASAFQNGATWKQAPQWARDAFQRIAEGMGDT